MAAESDQAADVRPLMYRAAGLLVLVAGCVGSPPLPAVLVAPDVQTREELLQTIRRALGRSTVTLADDALTKSPTLSVDHPNLRDQSGLPIDGRRLSRPDTFILHERHASCVITEVRTNREWALSHARCTPATMKAAPH